MKKMLLGILIGVFLSLSMQFCIAKNQKNYYEQYKKYKKLYAQCVKDKNNLGSLYESCYMDLIQCHRAINNENPWEEMMK